MRNYWSESGRRQKSRVWVVWEPLVWQTFADLEGVTEIWATLLKTSWGYRERSLGPGLDKVGGPGTCPKL